MKSSATRVGSCILMLFLCLLDLPAHAATVGHKAAAAEFHQINNKNEVLPGVNVHHQHLGNSRVLRGAKTWATPVEEDPESQPEEAAVDALTSPRLLKKKKKKICTGTVAEVQACCGDLCCVGTDACAWGGTATISKGSCNGDDACNFGTSNAAITVGANSCNGKSACYAVGLNAATSIKIGKGSCTGDNSCYGIGRETATSIIVGKGSCMGEKSCNSVGGNAISVIIGDGSCTDPNSCQSVGYHAATSGVTIGDGSCTDPESCRSLGFPATSVTIADLACTAAVCANVDDKICGDTRYVDLADKVNCAGCTCTSSP